MQDINNSNNTTNDAATLRKQTLKDLLRTNSPVSVLPSGEVVTQDEARNSGLSNIQIPEGKLA